MRQEGRYDVAVIGAGVIGAMIARSLSRYQLRVALLEAESDVAGQTSSANSGIVHAGYDAEPGTLKARLNVEGTRMMPALTASLHVPYRRTGSLVLAFDEADKEKLNHLLEQGRLNGVTPLSLLTGDQVRALEPAVSQEVVAALHAPGAGIVCPYQLTVGAVEYAVNNGVALFRSWPVRRIRHSAPDGVSDFLLMSDGATLSARYVVNAAGLYADEVAAMVGDASFQIHPRKGEYLLLDKRLGDTVNSVIFQTPGPMGKGILVAPTADGNLLMGPNALDVPDKGDTTTTFDGLRLVAQGGLRSIPSCDVRAVIRSFAGLRAVADGGDFIIGEASRVPGFIHVAGIDSPGLSAAPAIGEEVLDILSSCGLALEEKTELLARRAPLKRFSEMGYEERRMAVLTNPAFGHVVCRCETVTEAEIVDSIRRPAGATTLDGIKRRTRAGMGRCQGGFCTPRAVEILARELGISPDAVTKRGGDSYLLAGPSKPEICPVIHPSKALRDQMEVSTTKAPDIHEQNQSLEVPAYAAMVIIGAGPAGLAAAIEAKKSGVQDILVLEREHRPGGILGQCIHPGFGIHLFGEELTGPEYAERFIEEARAHDVRILCDTMVLELTADRRIVAVSSQYGWFTLQAGAVVLAMGCRERAAGALSIPGARPAGIMTAGSAQRFINMEGYLPGRRVVILGSGDIGLIMARRLTLEGAEVLMVCEVLPYAGGLTRNRVQCLDDFGIPLKCSHTVVGLHGKERLEGVTIAQVDEQRNPIPGTEFELACDTLLLSVGLIPENELSRSAGVPLNAVTGGPEVSMDMQTGIPGIFACGNVCHVHDLVDHVSEEGRLAGRSAARWARSGDSTGKSDQVDVLPGDFPGQMEPQRGPGIPVMAGEGIRYVLPSVLYRGTPEPESRLLFRVEEPARHVVIEVRAGTVVLGKIRKMRVIPGEMEVFQIKESWLSRIPEGQAVSVRVVPVATVSEPLPEADQKAQNRLDAIRLFVLDMDGTFYLGDRLLETSRGFLQTLEQNGRKWLFFTNNSSRSPRGYLDKLKTMGVPVQPEQLMTSGDVAVSFLSRERRGKSVFLLGTPALEEQFENAGIPLLKPARGWAPAPEAPRADIVMVGFDTTLQYDRLSQACWHIREGAEFLATHLDWNCPVEGGFIPDCGAMCALVEASTGKKPRYLGKPCPETLEAVLERTGAARETVAFVGDRLYTDVATGVNNGAHGILVLTGEAKEPDLQTSTVKPDWVFPSLKELGEALKGESDADAE